MSPNQDFSAMFSCPSALSCPCPIPFPLYTLMDVLIPMGFLVREQVNPHQQLYNNHSTSSCPSHIVTFKSAFLSSCTLLGDDNISVIMLVVMIPHLGRVAWLTLSPTGMHVDAVGWSLSDELVQCCFSCKGLLDLEQCSRYLYQGAGPRNGSAWSQGSTCGQVWRSHESR